MSLRLPGTVHLPATQQAALSGESFIVSLAQSPPTNQNQYDDAGTGIAFEFGGSGSSLWLVQLHRVLY
jgi:hypothetical protein